MNHLPVYRKVPATPGLVISSFDVNFGQIQKNGSNTGLCLKLEQFNIFFAKYKNKHFLIVVKLNF